MYIRHFHLRAIIKLFIVTILITSTAFGEKLYLKTGKAIDGKVLSVNYYFDELIFLTTSEFNFNEVTHFTTFSDKNVYPIAEVEKVVDFRGNVIFPNKKLPAKGVIRGELLRAQYGFITPETKAETDAFIDFYVKKIESGWFWGSSISASLSTILGFLIGDDNSEFGLPLFIAGFVAPLTAGYFMNVNMPNNRANELSTKSKEYQTKYYSYYQSITKKLRTKYSLHGSVSIGLVAFTLYVITIPLPTG